MLYKITYNNIAWKNMLAFIETDTKSEAIEALKKFNNYDEDLKVISIETTEKRTRYIVKQLKPEKTICNVSDKEQAINICKAYKNSIVINSEKKVIFQNA